MNPADEHTTHLHDDDDGVSELSRRAMFGLGFAAAAGGGLLALANGAPVSGATLPGATAGLQYLGIDAFAFLDQEGDRFYQTSTGSQADPPPPPSSRIWAPLTLPAGTIIREIAACYQGSPIIEISRRPFFDGVAGQLPQQVFQQTYANSTSQATTESKTANVVVDSQFTYTVSAFLGIADSILGIRIGYQGGYVPFTGATPRVLDTRTAGQGPALAPGVPRKVTLGLPGRAAVLNVTAAEPTGRGNIAAYAGDIAFPGNSSVNFVPGVNVANLVIVAMDATGAINLRAAFASTHVVVDRIGSIV
jgi:hypothetical protein